MRTLHFSIATARRMDPFGENAVGPENVKNAVSRFLARFGPLQTVQCKAHGLSPDIVLVDVNQITNRGEDEDMEQK